MPPPIRASLLPCALLLIGMVGSASGNDILRPRVESKKTFSESYTLIADLEGGAYVQLQLVVSNAGLTNRRGACRVLWVEPGRSTWTDDIQVSESEWSHRGGDQPTLEIGACSIVGGEKTVLRAAFEAGVVELVLDAPIEPIRPLDKRMQVGGAFYESDILIPWATARVTIEEPGRPPRTLEGHGYGDHSRSTTLPAELARRWVRFRGLNEGSSVLMLARFPTDGSQVDGWLWREGQPRPVALQEVRLERSSGEGGQWNVHAQSVAGSVYVITTRRQIHRYAPMEENGLVGRMLRGIAGNPVTSTYRAELRRPDEASGDLSGIAEVTIVDE